jgi:hypothetical protein
MQMKSSRRASDALVRLALCVGLMVFAMTALTPDTRAQTKTYMGVKIKPLMTIKVGDRGYCKTVFQGLTVSTFRFHVKGILFNYFPRQHLILIASNDPKLKLAGVVAGMSGSPCYISGGLAGALAYGPNWSKRPIAMLTPIRYMLDELKRKSRGLKGTPTLSVSARPRRAAATGLTVKLRRPVSGGLGRGRGQGMGRLARRPTRAGTALARRLLGRKNPRNPLSPWFRSIPAPRSARVRTGVAGMRRMSVPLSVSGFDRLTLKELAADLKPYGFAVVAGGGSSADAMRYYKKPKRFVNGGSIGVQLVRGAISMNGTGTVTLVKKNKILAFGHPMANWGEHYIPVTSSWIHMFMPGYSSSYKISTALGVLGSLVQDRRPCIIADTRKRAPVIPVKVTIVSDGGGKQDYSFEIFSNRNATSYYLQYVMRALLRRAVPDTVNTTISARISMDVTYPQRGRTVKKTVTLNDYFNAGKGAGLGFRIGSTRGFRILNFLLSQNLTRVSVAKLRIRIKADKKVRAATIESVRVDSNTVEPGQVVNLRVKLRRHLGQGRYVKTIPVVIPSHVVSGTKIRIDVAAGLSASVDAAPVYGIADVWRIIGRMYHARQLVVRVMRPAEGTSVNGRIISHLPGSVLDSLRSGSATKSRLLHRASFRKALVLPDVLTGSKRIYVRVERRP